MTVRQTKRKNRQKYITKKHSGRDLLHTDKVKNYY